MGANMQTMMSQTYPPKPTWFQKDMPDLSGKVMIVTGAKTGVGRETVKALLEHNAKVYLAARGKAQCEKVIAQLKEETGKEAIHLELDLANHASIRQSAAEFLSKESQLHVLFNNAGVMWPSLDLLTDEGLDLQWGVMVVGNHLFTNLLTPALVAGAKTSTDGKSRIITTSSSAAYLDNIHWDTFTPGPARTKLGTQSLYAQAKYAQIAWNRELARRLGDKNILCIVLNPGNVVSELQRHTGAIMLWILKTISLYPLVPYGALTQLYGGTSPDVLDMNGGMLIPWARVGPLPTGTTDPALGEKLWDYLEKENAKH